MLTLGVPRGLVTEQLPGPHSQRYIFAHQGLYANSVLSIEGGTRVCMLTWGTDFWSCG